MQSSSVGDAEDFHCSYRLPVVFTMHFPQTPLILLSLIWSREWSFAVMMKIPLPFWIMIKTPPKFSIHIHPSQAGQLCAENVLALFVNETRKRQGKTGLNSIFSPYTAPPLQLSAVPEGERRTPLELPLHCRHVLPQGNHVPLSQGTLLFSAAFASWEPVCSLLCAPDHTSPPRCSASPSFCFTGL